MVNMLRLPYISYDCLVKPFNSSTSISYVAACQVTFYKTDGITMADTITFMENATTIQTVTDSNKASRLPYTTYGLNQDVLIQAASATQVTIVDKNGRTFCQMNMFKSAGGLTMYYFGINVPYGYMQTSACGMLRDSCAAAQNMNAFEPVSGGRRRRTSGTAAASVDVSSTGDPNAGTMSNSLTTMQTSLASTASSNAAGSDASKPVMAGGISWLVTLGSALLTTLLVANK